MPVLVIVKGYRGLCNNIYPARKSRVCFLVRVSIAVKTHSGYSKLYKVKHLIGVAYSFRGLVYCHSATWWHAGRHGAEK